MVRELRTEELGKQEVVRIGMFICLGLLFSWDPSLVYISQRLCGVPRTELLAMPITYRLVIISDKGAAYVENWPVWSSYDRMSLG
jgi:hypothetical protein